MSGPGRGGDRPEGSGRVRFHHAMGRRVRTGDWTELGVSTYRLAAAAVEESRFEDAAELVDHLLVEAEESRRLYPAFIGSARSFLLSRGVDRDEVAEEEGRILDHLRLPGGSDFDFERGWEAFGGAVGACLAACEDRRRDETLAALERAREIWRATHDRACDWVYGMVDAGARLLGEDAVGEMWDAMMGPTYGSRDAFDLDRRPWPESVEMLVLDTAETFRGHLSGPGRLGDVEVVEEADRWVFRFSPCGSGGRTLRDDPDEDRPPRMEPPYNYAVTTRSHDWSWNREGVCLYCVHCCQLQERIPIRRFGYPVRVIEPPIWPEARDSGSCTWSVYKDPSLVPREAYQRVGEQKPDRLGSRARGREGRGGSRSTSKRPLS